jgi:hypothetical protein
MQKCMLDISGNDDLWDPSKLTDTSTVQVSHNRNMALNVKKGDFVLVPRLENGVVYLGKIKNKFELVNDPPWADEYFDIRKEQHLSCDQPKWHYGDIVQSWEVEDFRDIPFPFIPRWISYSLLAQRTIGWVRNRPNGLETAAEVLRQMYEDPRIHELRPTLNLKEIESRLLNLVSPSMLEHMVCALLQLEHPKYNWFHTGGTGDCGTDGMAIDRAGN